MALNGTEWLNDPAGTTFSPFTDLLGSAFWLIPISFIGLALYIKTRNPVLVSAYMLAVGLMLSSGTIFSGYPEMAMAYMVFAMLGLIGLIVGIFFMRR